MCIHMSHLFTIKSCELLHIAIKEADILSTHTTDLTCSCIILGEKKYSSVFQILVNNSDT